MSKKKILFLHQNFPGQYKHLAPILSKSKKYEVHSLSLDEPQNAKIKKRTLCTGFLELITIIADNKVIAPNK